MNKTVFECSNVYKTRGMNNGDLRLVKSNTSLMCNFYTNRGIRSFNQLPSYIKITDNGIKFKTMIKKLFMQASQHFVYYPIVKIMFIYSRSTMTIIIIIVTFFFLLLLLYIFFCINTMHCNYV